MRIILTGSAGRIGRAIAVRLMPFHELIGLDKAPASTVDVVGDIADNVLLRRLCRGADAVIHTAALHAPHVGLVPDAEFWRINVDSTRRIADIALDAGVKGLVFTSTTALYGASSRAQDTALWVDAATEPHPLTVYHRTKLAAEDILRTLASETDLCVRILRMSRCFPEPAPQMALYRLYRGVDARDVAEAHALAVQNIAQNTVQNSTLEKCQTYIISGATPFVQEDAALLRHDAEAVLRLRAPNLARDFDERGWALPHSIDRVYDSSHAQKSLGWAPRFSYNNILALLDEGIAEVLPPFRVQTQG